MNVSIVVLDIVMIVLAPIITMLLIGALSRRLLGVRVGVIRILMAGLLGLAAEIGFES